jgi:hypothetical protein
MSKSTETNQNALVIVKGQKERLRLALRKWSLKQSEGLVLP